MKRLHDLRNLLSGNARLSRMESLRIKGGSEKRRDRPSADVPNDNDNDNSNDDWSTGG
ncbi:MAG: hypothetical protein AAFW73_16200 [Bacteroidota bacterium]